MRFKLIILTLLIPLVTFSQVVNINDSAPQIKKNEVVLTLRAAKDSIRAMRATLGLDPNWAELHKQISHKFPVLSADSSISILKISHYHNDLPNLEPTLLEFILKHGKAVPIEELNKYAWAIFLNSTNRELIKELIRLFGVRLKNQGNSEAASNWYDTYAGLLYKVGKKEEALKQQMQAYNMLTGEELMLDLTDGSITAGAAKADFLITAFKIEKGVPIWEQKSLDSISADWKKEVSYWKKLRVRMLPIYGANKADSLIAFTKLQYAKSNKQWNNYTSTLIKFVNKYEVKSTSAQKNKRAWDVFSHSNDRRVLEAASDWLIDIVRNINDSSTSGYIDTYANLLYKAGRNKEAISWQQKAVDIASEKRKAGLIATLDKMKRGDKTWK